MRLLAKLLVPHLSRLHLNALRELKTLLPVLKLSLSSVLSMEPPHSSDYALNLMQKMRVILSAG